MHAPLGMAHMYIVSMHAPFVMATPLTRVVKMGKFIWTDSKNHRAWTLKLEPIFFRFFFWLSPKKSVVLLELARMGRG